MPRKDHNQVSNQQADALARAARAYASRGWAVLPLKPRAKVPLVAHGVHDASSDVDQVLAWWTKWPDANIGLVPASAGLVAADVDSEDAEREAQRLGLLAEPTLCGITGAGEHRFFTVPAGAPALDGWLGRLLFRHRRGFIVVSPSIHPSGRPYRWAGKLEDARPLPDAAMREIMARGKATPTLAASSSGGRRVFGSERAAVLTSFAGSLRRQGLDEVQIAAVLRKAAEEVCAEPLEGEEVARIASSIARYPAGPTAAPAPPANPRVLIPRWTP